MLSSRRRLVPLFVLVALAGAAAGAFAAKKLALTPSVFSGKEKAAAAAELVSAARSFAESGSFENLAVARLLYLTGQKAEAQVIFDRVLADPKVAAGDYMRVGRIHWEAGEWELARPMFDKVLQLKPKDEDWNAEIGAYFLVKGDRVRAEQLFAASLAEDPSNLYNTLKMAGGYLGLAPRE